MARNGFPGGMGGGNMQQLMRQAQKMQQDMARIQQEISEREFTASVGGGVVSATVLGTKELKAITIDPSCVDQRNEQGHRGNEAGLLRAKKKGQ